VRPHFDVVLCASGATTDFCRCKDQSQSFRDSYERAFEQETGLPTCGRAEGKANCCRAIVARNLQQAFGFLFGCWHRNLSRPFTLSGRTYEVCLSCGKEFAYIRVDFGRNFPRRKEEIGLDRQDVVGADGEMRIDVGIWTELSTNARDTNRPLLIQPQPDNL
jgi:hypothetical protein